MDEEPARNLVDQVLDEVTRPLRVHDVRYILVGALAVMAHGAPRMTQDLDVRVDLSGLQQKDLVRMLGDLGHPLEGPERNEFGLRYVMAHPDFLVEFYLAGDHPYVREEFDRAVAVRFGRVVHPVLSPEDVVIRKLYNTRVRRSPYDQPDVLGVLRAQKETLDVEYIRERARMFRLLERFETLWVEAHR